MNWIEPLRNINLADIERVGGKAAHLGAMLQAGFPVPDGFVITIDAFIEHFGHQTEPLVRPSTPKLHVDLMAEVVDALITYLGEETSVAVRSSSNEEDGELASFAGQHSTYYFVPPSQLDQAIVDCWMSLWSKPALAYRRGQQSLAPSGHPLRMAVIVQKMVPATRSGITFSKDPLGRHRHVVTEASWGLGAALVDGHVTPDLSMCNEEGEMIDYQVRDKRSQVPANHSDIDGNRLQPLAESLRHRQVLSIAETERLANIALQLETLFESPQDIEWSFVDDNLHILQSRPITGLPCEYRGDRQLVLFKPLAENFTDALSPLAVDLFAGVLPKIGEFHNGRLYIDIALAKTLMPYEMSDQQIAELLLLRPPSEPLQVSPAKAVKALLLLSAAFLIDGANWIRAARLRPADLENYAAICHKLANNRRKRLKQRFKEMVWARHSFAPAYAQMFMANFSSGRYFLYIALLETLVKRWAPHFPLQDLPKIYHGREDMRSMEMLADMGNLRQLINQHPEIRHAALANPSELPVGHPFTIAFDAFLNTYGHRGPKEIDIAAPRWRETAAELLRLLATGEDSTTPQSTHGDFLAARNALSGSLRTWQRRVITYLADTIGHFIALRENTRHYHVLAFDRMRQQLLDFEHELMIAGQIRQAGDIFFLLADEIEDLQSDALAAVDAQQRIRVRRRRWQMACKQNTPETLNIEMGTPSKREGLTGICASSGVIVGTVRVVNQHRQGYELEPGEILVAPYTDPAWTPLFSIAAGVIVANGSFLSHAGTVARELHLPCLVDVQDCMQQLESGQRVRLDATAGVVEVL